MTAKALIKQAEWRRMAAISKETGMTTWVEIEGKKYGVSPVIPEIHSQSKVDRDISYGGNSLSEWRARREGKSSGNSSRQEKAR